MPDLVVCSLEPWDEVWRRNQFLVAGLLADDPQLRVLFVEPSPDPLYSLASRVRPRRGRGLRPVPQVSDRLFVLELTKWLPRAAGPAAERWLRAGLRRAVRRSGLTDPLLWINDPGWAELVRDTGWPAVYDITDDWLAADRSEREHQRLVDREQLLMERCAAVVVCSRGLAETKGRIRDVTLIPNAVDVERFRRPRARPHDLPDGPLVLYVGTLHEDRLDVELCLDLARRLHQVGGRLGLLGPSALDPGHTAALAAEPGVWLAGPRPNSEVPAYLQHATVLAVPHRVDEFTDSLDPIKLYEYLAVGRPVVSTPVAGFRDLTDVAGVRVVDRAALAAAAVELVTSPPPVVGPVDVPDWSVRVHAMAEVLAGLSSGPGRPA